jgi:hypothetical protein
VEVVHRVLLLPYTSDVKLILNIFPQAGELENICIYQEETICHDPGVKVSDLNVDPYYGDFTDVIILFFLDFVQE